MKKDLKKLMKNLLSIMMICTMATSTAFAHSGRTDANGGHRDNKNVSGLGYYHYHCGGYPAHLHPGGVCPYKSNTSSSSASQKSASSTVSAKVQPQKKYVRLSDAKTYINGYEIPTFRRTDMDGLYLIAEDLKDYGFDTSWNANDRTLSIVKNISQPIKPLNMDYYRSIGTKTNFFTINDVNTVRVILKNTYEEIGYSPVSYSCGGYMLISIDELKAFTENWSWNSNTKTMTYIIQ